MLTENQTTRSLTMLEVLSLGTGGTHTDPEGVAKHITAAYLNIKGGNNAVIPSNVLTVSQLKLIWTGWNTNGKYEVMANIFWNGAQIKNYLISNGIVG